MAKLTSACCKLPVYGRFLKERLHGQFVRDVFVYASGTAGGQAITAASGLVLLRLFSPQAIGILGVYAALLGIIAAVSSMRYEMAIPIAASGQDVANLAALSAILISGICAVAWVALHWAGQYLPAKFLPVLPYIPLLIAGVLCTSAVRVLIFVNIRTNRFGILAKSSLGQASAMAGIQLGAGAMGAGPVWLMVGHVSGQVVGGLISARGLRRLASGGSLSLGAIRRVAGLFSRFPKYSAPAVLINSVGTSLPVLTLAGAFGLGVAGWYAVVTTAAAGPLSILGKAIGRVNFADMAGGVRAGNRSLRAMLLTRALLLAVVGAAVIGCANLLAWLFVPTLFGARWVNSIYCLQALSPWLVLDFVSSPLGYALDATERQDLHLLREILRLLSLVLVVLAVVGIHMGWRTAVGIFSAVGCGDALVYLGFSYLAVSKPHRSLSATA